MTGGSQVNDRIFLPRALTPESCGTLLERSSLSKCAGPTIEGDGRL